MGSVYVSRTRDACTLEELQQWFDEETARQRHERGHRVYANVWETHFKVLPQSFSTEAQACEFIQNNAVKWGAVLAARVGDFSQVFPVSKADKALAARLSEVTDARLFFDFDVATRVRTQKSAKKTCNSCSSTINVQKLWMPTRQEYKQAASRRDSLGTLPTALSIRGQLEFVTYQRLTDCPVCGKNLMLTETDLKRRDSLVTKEAELCSKVKAAKAAFDAKQSAPPPLWYLGSWCPD